VNEPLSSLTVYIDSDSTGALTYENIAYGADGLSAALFTRALGWSKLELDVFLAKVRRDMANPTIHAYWPM
jgi:hypothetical protein